MQQLASTAELHNVLFHFAVVKYLHQQLRIKSIANQTGVAQHLHK